MNKTTSFTAQLLSFFILLLTMAGFASGFLPIERNFLEFNTILIVVHLILTFIFFFVAYLCMGLSIHALQVIGITYILISGIGFIVLNDQINGEWPHVIYLNLLSYFQFGLGITLCASGSALGNQKNKLLLIRGNKINEII